MAEFCAGIIFMDEEHKRFFTKNLPKCRDFDVYHMALIYCLESTGLSGNILRKYMI